MSHFFASLSLHKISMASSSKGPTADTFFDPDAGFGLAGPRHVAPASGVTMPSRRSRKVGGRGIRELSAESYRESYHESHPREPPATATCRTGGPAGSPTVRRGDISPDISSDISSRHFVRQSVRQSGSIKPTKFTTKFMTKQKQ